jgi:hypothetical protein
MPRTSEIVLPLESTSLHTDVNMKFAFEMSRDRAQVTHTYP